jgi:PAS domain S-box-containing protein
MLTRAVDIGVITYLIKPVDKEQIIKALVRTAKMIQLEREKEHYFKRVVALSSAIEQGHSLILITGTDGRVEFFNQEFCRLFTGCEQLKDSDILDLFKNKNTDYAQLALSIKSRTRWKGELIFELKGNKPLWAAVTLSPIENSAGVIKNFLLVIEDITSQVVKQEELAQAREKLEKIVKERTLELEIQKNKAEEANRAKSMFLAKVSHELRTPMNGILGMTGLLMDSKNISPDEKDKLGIVKQSADSLLVLINDLLDFSGITEGKFKLKPYNFSPAQIYKRALETIRNAANIKQLELKSFISPELPAELFGDGNKLCQVVINLLSNAVKFTEEGEVIMSVKSKAVNGMVEIETIISDTGIGIENNTIDIFESFTQIENTMTRKYGGAGLGLKISREIVNRMNGDIRYESIPGKGSVFTFNVVMELPAETAKNPLEFPVPLKLLLVEDGRINQKVFYETLRDYPVEIHLAEKGKDAIHKLSETIFDAALIDINLPDITGREVAEAAYNSINSNTALIAVSALSEEQLEDEHLALFDAFLGKPVEKEILIDYLFYVSKIKTGNSLDIEKLERSIKGNKILKQELIDYYLKSSKDLLRQIKLNNKSGKAEELFKSAHKLKSETSYFGGKPIMEITSAIKGKISSGSYDSLIRNLSFELKYFCKLMERHLRSES